MAIGTYDAILESGRSIPDDISVIGHDDIEASCLVRPRLTTMTTYRHRLGEAAVELLFQQIDGSAETGINETGIMYGKRRFSRNRVTGLSTAGLFSTLPGSNP